MKKPKQPKLRIIHNNLEFDRIPVARVLDVSPSLLDKFEQFVDEIQELELKTKELENKLKLVSKEKDNAFETSQ